MMEMPLLNSAQKEAVLDDSRVCLVNACVGSGKTTVLTAKIRYLHEERNVPYEDMAVLTFTNKAAGEIGSRLRSGREEMPWAGTFHSVALKLLKEVLPVTELGLGQDFLVMSPEEEEELALFLIRREKLQIKYKNRLKKRLERETVSKYGDDLDILRELLEKEKKRLNKMTFDDLIGGASVLLEAHPVPFKWVLIDEVQDMDTAQLRMVQAMKGVNAQLFAVGDPNQVIYSWRGSLVNVFMKLKSLYPAREISLPVNYRSDEAILKAARYFKMQGGEIICEGDAGMPVKLREQYDAFQDADHIAGRLKELHEEGTGWNEMAVFYRLQSQSEVFENVLMREGIPCILSIRKRLTDIPVLIFVIRVLRYMLRPEDAFTGISAVTDRFYGCHLTAKKAEKYLAEGKDFAGRMQRCIAALGPEIPEPEEIYTFLGLDDRLNRTSASFEEDRRMTLRFLESICRDMKTAGGSFPDSLAFVLDSVVLESSAYIDDLYEQPEEGVHLMTLHASKGLEFEAVFITGANDGLIPLKGGAGTDEDEERRLFFVGMTRARRILEISWYTNPGRADIAPGPGKFIRSIPSKYCIREEKARGIAGLQQLKRQILEESQAAQEKERRVRLDKYGIGTIVSEDDMMLKVNFEDYGEKEFIKAFTSFEYVD